MRKKVIIDCDPGHDDIMAILLSLAHPDELEILGYTTVCGNNLVEKVTRNLAQVLTVIGRTGTIVPGYDSPLVLPAEPQPDAHGETGLGGPNLPEPTVQPLQRHALDWLKETLEESEEKITIIALAPLTNIAMLLKTYPHLKKKIECITLMGGGIHRGNITAKAEFNIYADPHAARIVFRSGVPIIMSGIEVCDDGSILHSDVEQLKGQGTVQQLTYEILEFFCQYSKSRGADRSPLFDVVPVMHLLHPEYFTSEKHFVDIELYGEHTRGMTVVDTRPYIDEAVKNTEVLLTCDREKFITTFLDSLKRLDNE